MIKIDDPRMKAAIDAAIASGATIGDAAILSDIDARTIVNVEENVFEQDDEFELPANRAEALPFMGSEEYKSLPKDAQGNYRKGYYVLVEVTNKRTGNNMIKKFRPSAVCASARAFKYDEAQQAYLATGENFGPTNALAKTIGDIRTLGGRFDALWGKKLKVVSTITGDEALREGRVVTGVRRRTLPVFDEVKK